MSDKYVSRAFIRDDGSMACRVSPRSNIQQFIERHNYMPRLLRLGLFLVDSFGSGKKGLLFILALLVYPVIRSLNLFGHSTLEPASDSNPFLTAVFTALPVLFVIGGIYFLRKYIAPWHGAEHMAISAYQKSGKTDVETIKNGNRIDPHCGGRFLLPFLLVGVASYYLSSRFHFNQFLCYLVSLEIVLWIDRFIGWWRIPGFAQASRLLQKHITTAEPSGYELALAHHALKSLVGVQQAVLTGERNLRRARTTSTLATRS